MDRSFLSNYVTLNVLSRVTYVYCLTTLSLIFRCACFLVDFLESLNFIL